MRVHVGDGLFCFEGVGSRCVCVGMEGSVHPVCVCKVGVRGGEVHNVLYINFHGA